MKILHAFEEMDGLLVFLGARKKNVIAFFYINFQL
jgi:hypothetical protein